MSRAKQFPLNTVRLWFLFSILGFTDDEIAGLTRWSLDDIRDGVERWSLPWEQGLLRVPDFTSHLRDHLHELRDQDGDEAVLGAINEVLAPVLLGNLESPVE